ncbi:MAG: hypothetical protein IKY46_07885 [Clostridia bacterium]|nr:hypothetical protein [Clostridia bacterium]MBR5903833.1 hypothetical protein [Clostridia bacterium]
MKKAKEIKLNALRAEIQRLRGELWTAKRESIAHQQGAAECIELTEKVIMSALKACGLTEIEMAVDVNDTDTLEVEKTESGFKVRIRSTESDNNGEDSTV